MNYCVLVIYCGEEWEDGLRLFCGRCGFIHPTYIQVERAVLKLDVVVEAFVLCLTGIIYFRYCSVVSDVPFLLRRTQPTELSHLFWRHAVARRLTARNPPLNVLISCRWNTSASRRRSLISRNTSCDCAATTWRRSLLLSRLSGHVPLSPISPLRLPCLSILHDCL